MTARLESTAEFSVGYRVQNAWSSLVAWDLFLSGTGAGLFFLAILLAWFGQLSASASAQSGWLGIVLAAAAGVTLMADLGVRSRFLAVLRRPRASWVSRGAWTMLLFCLFGVLTLAPSLPGLGELPWPRESPAGFALAAVALLLSLAVMSYTGLLLASWNSIAFWNTPLLPVLFVTSSLLAGAGTLALVIRANAGEPGSLLPLTWGLLFAVAVETLVYLLIMRGGHGPAQQSVRLLLSGREGLIFVAGFVLVGLVVPAVLLIIAGPGGATPLPSISGVAILIGGFSLRWLVLRTGVYDA